MGTKHASQRKHIPQRMCVVCRQRYDKRALTRLVLLSTGLHVDDTGRSNGRGAYLCDRPECWDRAYRTSILDSALRVTLTEADKQALLQRQT